MTEQNYQRIFCSNMMKTNQDIKDGLSEQMVDIFIENSECPHFPDPVLFRFDAKWKKMFFLIF